MTRTGACGASRPRRLGSDHGSGSGGRGDSVLADGQTPAPDSTAVRVALWRALHTRIDPPPHVLEDETGLRLADPDEGWQRRGDMDPHGTSTYRASIVARARFIEDLVVEQAGQGVGQYVLLGDAAWTPSPSAGRRSPRACGCSRSTSPAPRPGSARRLTELGFGIPDWLRLVPVDFEAAWVVVGPAESRRIRRGPALGGGLGRRQHVSHQGGERGHAAAGSPRSPPAPPW